MEAAETYCTARRHILQRVAAVLVTLAMAMALIVVRHDGLRYEAVVEAISNWCVLGIDVVSWIGGTRGRRSERGARSAGQVKKR